MIPREWLQEADRRIRPLAIVTPITEDPRRRIFLKWENHQVTGSFKLRGALNKVLTLASWELAHGLVTCSAGNHGQGVALAARQQGIRVIVFASRHAVPEKIKAMQAYGAEIRLVDGGYALAEKQARAFAENEGMPFISPYNDGQVIAGQGTIGLELMLQIPDLNSSDALFVPVGGGGLAAGIASALYDLERRPQIIGVQSEASPFFHALFYTGSQEGVVEYDSIADGLAGEVEQGSITIPLVRKLLNQIQLVSEGEIEDAIRLCWWTYNEKVEGSAAAALAAALKDTRTEGRKICILTGGNIQTNVFERICAQTPPRSGETIA